MKKYILFYLVCSTSLISAQNHWLEYDYSLSPQITKDCSNTTLPYFDTRSLKQMYTSFGQIEKYEEIVSDLNYMKITGDRKHIKDGISFFSFYTIESFKQMMHTLVPENPTAIRLVSYKNDTSAYANLRDFEISLPVTYLDKIHTLLKDEPVEEVLSVVNYVMAHELAHFILENYIVNVSKTGFSLFHNRDTASINEDYRRGIITRRGFDEEYDKQHLEVDALAIFSLREAKLTLPKSQTIYKLLSSRRFFSSCTEAKKRALIVKQINNQPRWEW